MTSQQLTRRGFLRAGAATAAAVGGLALTSCQAVGGNSATGGSAKKLPFAYQPGYEYGLYYVANEHGWFDGFELSPMTIFQQGADEANAMLKGQFAAGVLGATGLLSRAAQHLPLRIIGTLANGAKNYGVVTQDHVKDVSDLSGRRVGVTIGTNYHYFLLEMLKKYSVRASAVNIVAMDPLAAQSAFIAGRLDAIVPITVNIDAILAKRKGAKVLFRASQFAEPPNPQHRAFAIDSLLAATDDQIDKHGDELTALMRVYHTKVYDLVTKQFSAAVDDVYTWQKQVVKADVTKDIIHKGLKGYDFYPVGELKKWFTGGGLAAEMSGISDFLLGQKIIKTPVKAADVIDADLVKKL